MKTLTRVEAWDALRAGKKVERVYLLRGGIDGGCAVELRWHEDHGIQYRLSAGGWDNESGTSDPGAYAYREVFTPRVFLGVWEEVQTFEEAEKASESGFFRFACRGDWSQIDEKKFSYELLCIPKEVTICVFQVSFEESFHPSDCWVRRIPGK